uniref:phosphotransferase n=1 Tax=Paenibacillus sp. Y5S-9 TaxID=3122489 RepID=UPI00403F1E8C
MNIQDLPIEIKEHIGEVQKITFPKQGHTSTVAILDTFDQKYVIKKTENDLYNEWLLDEYKVLQYLYHTGLPVPKAYLFHIEDTSRWLLMDYIDGISLREFSLRCLTSKVKKKRFLTLGFV